MFIQIQLKFFNKTNNIINSIDNQQQQQQKIHFLIKKIKKFDLFVFKKKNNLFIDKIKKQ
jgi:hypothetical protein